MFRTVASVNIVYLLTIIQPVTGVSSHCMSIVTINSPVPKLQVEMVLVTVPEEYSVRRKGSDKINL